MEFRYKRSLFIFRRDLRLDDNTGLLNALGNSEFVIPCFIFDPRQCTQKNKYRSMNAIQFMLESLDGLEKQLKSKKGKLYRFYGLSEDVVEKLLERENINAVFVNRDYTPFSIKRDKEIAAHCYKHNTEFVVDNDLLLTQPDEVKTMNGTSYKIFTPFYRRASTIEVNKPVPLKNGKFYTKAISGVSKNIFEELFNYNNKHIHVHGGRENGLNILNNINEFKEYTKTRDFPEKSTTNLSAYLKFGCVSVREAYYAIIKKLGQKHPLARQLYWRDFFTHVAYNSPFVFGHPYHEKFEKLKWSLSKKMFDAWRHGRTGFPIVDAGMRQLNETGFMHNRVRMIVGSFLVKDLHINWLRGEKYFAQQLVDYDPSVNNGNWQWVASTGTDSQPYFRIFNPWLQQKKFDPQCSYIKKWVPELKDLKPKEIHTLYKPGSRVKGYPAPIVDHSKEARVAKELYKQVG